MLSANELQWIVQDRFSYLISCNWWKWYQLRTDDLVYYVINEAGENKFHSIY